MCRLNGYVYRILWMLLLATQAGCFTRGLIHNAMSRQYVSQKVDTIADAYISKDKLIINFTQRVEDSRETRWHMVIHIDSLLQLHLHSDKNLTLLSKEMQSVYKATHLYTVTDDSQEFKNYGNGVVAELHYAVMEKGFRRRPDNLPPANVYLLRNSDLFIYSPYTPPPDRSNSSSTRDAPNRQNMVFLYYPEKDAPWTRYSFIGISVESKKQRHIKRLLLLPIAFAADVITAPIQAVAGKLLSN